MVNFDGKFLRPFTEFIETFRRKKYLGMFTYPISYCKNMKMAGYIRLKLCVRVVVDDAPMGTCTFEN